MNTRTPVLLVLLLAMASPRTVTAGAKDTWVDTSQHKMGAVKANGIKLAYLDWGGSGPPLILLAGAEDTAHVYDEFGPKLAYHFHVIGLTRRGFGQSDKPNSGYDVETLVEDIHKTLLELKLKRVILAGHGIAGCEMTRLAIKYPDDVDKLVYLDAAYDRTHLLEISARQPAQPAPSMDDEKSLIVYLKWLKKTRPIWSPACEASYRDTRDPTPGFNFHTSTPAFVPGELLKGSLVFHPDYARIKCPILAFFAFDNQAEARWLAQMPRQPADVKGQERKYLDRVNEDVRRQIESLKAASKDAQVVELQDTVHYCFIQNDGEVIRQMLVFLNTKPGAAPAASPVADSGASAAPAPVVGTK